MYNNVAQHTSSNCCKFAMHINFFFNQLFGWNILFSYPVCFQKEKLESMDAIQISKNVSTSSCILYIIANSIFLYMINHTALLSPSPTHGPSDASVAHTEVLVDCELVCLFGWLVGFIITVRIFSVHTTLFWTSLAG